MQVTFVVLNMVFGLLTCFFGYRLLRFWLAAVGWQVGVTAVTTLTGDRINNDVLLFVLALLAGFVLAIVFYSLFRPAVFVAGAFVFGYLAYLVILAMDRQTIAWAAIPVGLAGGILTLLAHRPILIFITALGGSLAAVDNAAALFLDRLPLPLLRVQTPVGGLPIVLYGLAVIILFALGMVVQFRQPESASVSAGVFDTPDRSGAERLRRTPFRDSRRKPDDPAAGRNGLEDQNRDGLRDRRPPDDRDRR